MNRNEMLVLLVRELKDWSWRSMVNFKFGDTGWKLGSLYRDFNVYEIMFSKGDETITEKDWFDAKMIKPRVCVSVPSLVVT